MKNRVLLCSVSAKGVDISSTHLALTYKYCFQEGEVEYLPISNVDTKSLAEIYNKVLYDPINSHFEYILFVHDDVKLERSNIVGVLDDHIGAGSDYSICGLAGSTSCAVQDINLWHMMAPRQSGSGSVSHPTKSGGVAMSMFGEVPMRVLLLDGLFLGCRRDVVVDAGLRWDEEYPSKFHFYDLDVCLRANSLGLKMTTVPIWVTHMSHGLQDFSDEQWGKGNEFFKKKWGKQWQD